MTQEEQRALSISVDLCKAIEALPDPHPADVEEAHIFFIHGLQNIIMARVARRANLDFFN